MAYQPKELITAKQAENSQTTQYTATNVTAMVQLFSATNTTAGAVTISINVVPNSGSAADSNLIVDSKSVAPNSTVVFPELSGAVIENGGFISTIASAASSITIKASGVEIT